MEVAEGSEVAFGAEAGDDGDAGGGGEGDVAEGLAAVEVGDVDLDGGAGGAEEGVAEGDAGVGEGAAVDDNAIDAGIGGGGDAVEEGALVVALEKIEMGVRGEFGAEGGFEVGEGGGAVDLGLTFAEAVEVRAVEDEEGFHGTCGTVGRESGGEMGRVTSRTAPKARNDQCPVTNGWRTEEKGGKITD